MVEQILAVGGGTYAVLRFINFTLTSYRNAQYVKTGVQSHMHQGMTERDAILYEHGYNHKQSIRECMTDTCAALG